MSHSRDSLDGHKWQPHPNWTVYFCPECLSVVGPKDSFEGLKKELKEHGYPHVEALMLIRNMNVTDLMAIMEPTDAQR